MFYRIAFGDLCGGVVMSTQAMPKCNQCGNMFLSEMALTLAVKTVTFIFGLGFFMQACLSTIFLHL